ncbi:MAG TPA: hypothetical protein VEB22_07555, partial [Phycisphaerales bacterium]|nr:hypothetical protein [Phycisphaerales bacterium]
TSRGVMVIRNERANNGANVDAYPADPDPRPRRIDEIIFAAIGSYTSQQQPITVDGTPVSSSEAMIYYGHGARQNPQAAGASGFNSPVLVSDTNGSAPPLGVNPGAGGSKVNQYASEWTLVRRAFVMAPPATQRARQVPGGLGFGGPITIRDSALEISGLPAAASPNRYDAANWQSLTTFAPSFTLRGNGVFPALSSGVVDIIAMDLRTVAAQLTEAASGGNLGASFFMHDQSTEVPVGGMGVLSAQYQHMWMRGLLPADSDNGARIRVETTVPDFLNFNGAAATPVERADQLMLTSGAFLPRCSEFIVEYSFGAARTVSTGPNADVGAVYWHGLDRSTGVNTAGNDYGRRVVRYQDWVSAPNGGMIGGLVPVRSPGALPNGFTQSTWGVQPDLIEPPAVGAWGTGSTWSYNGTSSYAFFGLNDPLYAPRTDLLAKDVNGDGNYDWADGDILQEPETLPWVRPTMIRVTLTICDPTDPSIEQTFQFVFDLPKDARGVSM